MTATELTPRAKATGAVSIRDGLVMAIAPSGMDDMSLSSHHQLPPLHPHLRHEIRQLELLPLLEQLLLQPAVHQSHRNPQAADPELRRGEGDVAVADADVTPERDPQLFALDHGGELAADDVILAAELAGRRKSTRLD